jgi:hypothetical protein
MFEIEPGLREETSAPPCGTELAVALKIRDAGPHLSGVRPRGEESRVEAAASGDELVGPLINQ